MRERLSRAAGPEVAQALPQGYQRLGDVLLLRLPASLASHAEMIGELYREELGVASVLVVEGGAEGELRRPRTRLVAGDRTETVHQEEGVRWHLDPALVMFAAGNRSERRRAGELVRPGEMVADLFAGIGYFTIPAARFGRPRAVHAVERNPRSYDYLLRNAKENRVADLVVPYLGDNREVELPRRSFDRVFMGLLPTSLPFLARALELLKEDGGWVHAHFVVTAPTWLQGSREEFLGALAPLGGELLECRPRRVKPYGPSKTHVVVDARLRPPGRRA